MFTPANIRNAAFRDWGVFHQRRSRATYGSRQAHRISGDSGRRAGRIARVDLDVAAALSAAPDACRFFESLPTFYRKNYMRWIHDAKRPETRAKRVAEMVELLSAGKRER